MPLRLRYDSLPELLQRGQVVVHPAACLVVGKCYLVLKHRHGAGNMRPCCGDPVFPGARSDASLWGPGCSWGSQWRKGVATGSLLLGALATMTRQSCGDQCQPGAHNSWDLHFSSFAGVSERRDANLRGPSGSGSQAVAEIGGDGARAVAKWVCVLRPTQRRAPNYSHCRPPTSPCRSQT